MIVHWHLLNLHCGNMWLMMILCLTFPDHNSIMLTPELRVCLQIHLRAYSAVGLLWHGWAWPTCTTSTTLPCKSNASWCCPTKATWFIRDTLVFARAPSNVRRFVLTAICNENGELWHTTPEPATRITEAATPATLLLPEIWRVLCCLTGGFS